VALLLLGCPRTWVEEGDRFFAQDDVQSALSLYRRMERTYGSTPATQIRIGNALYRMLEPDRAAAAYLEALRHLEPHDQQARFVASFNLGNSLLEQKRYTEARDQFWGALRANPDSLEAKFNYEWAAQRSEPFELPPPPPVRGDPPPGSPGAGDGEAPSEDGSMGPSRPGSAARERTDAERRAAPQLSEAEARRWLETIEDSIEAPLRRQVADSLGAGPQRRLGGQTW
jgi:tetratricopeptide (TPR) repeat protein